MLNRIALSVVLLAVLGVGFLYFQKPVYASHNCSDPQNFNHIGDWDHGCECDVSCGCSRGNCCGFDCGGGGGDGGGGGGGCSANDNGCGPWDADGCCGGFACYYNGSNFYCDIAQPPPPCYSSPPSGGLTPLYPSSGVTGVTSPVNFSWSGVGSWGTGCPSNNNSYTVYLSQSGGGYSAVCSTGATSCSVGVTEGKNYCWYVGASNGSATVNSGTVCFKTNYKLQGWTWDATGKACSADKSSNEIAEDDVEGSVTPSISGGPTGVWNPGGFSNFSYEINNAPDGSRVVCALPIAKLPGFRYLLSCLNNGSSGVISGSCASINIDESPERADLGYKLFSKGWFTTLSGDVYGGGGGPSVSAGIPAAADILGGFKDFLIQGVGTVFGNGDLSVKNSDGVEKYSQDSNRHARFIGYPAGNWPVSYDFIAPMPAEEIGDCSGFLKNGGLDPAKVYKADAACVQEGIDSVATSYKLSGDGIAVVYVEGGDELTFGETGKLFRADSADQRVVFVVDGTVLVSKDLGDVAPTIATRPQIEAAFVVSQSLGFETAGDKNGDAIPDDTSALVEGPIITKAGVDFDRDRGLGNGYPSEVVAYKSLYLDALPQQDLESDVPNYTGLSVVDISWEIAE